MCLDFLLIYTRNTSNLFFFFSSRRRHTRWPRDWSSDVCSSDLSVQVDEYATARARFRNAELEFERNRERYAFLRWGQQAFENLQVVPPNTGIVHQLNLGVVGRGCEWREGWAVPDTLG